MNQEVKLVGCLAQFALAGTVEVSPGSGTTGRDYLPGNAAVDGSAVALWMPLGIIADVGEKIGSTKIEIYKPSPGTLTLADLRESKFKRTITLKISECSNLMFLALRRALTTTSPRTGAIGQHVPVSSGTIRGWIKIQAYNQDTNSQELAEQVWCALSIDSDVNYGNDKNIEFTVMITQLYSSHNSATGA